MDKPFSTIKAKKNEYFLKEHFGEAIQQDTENDTEIKADIFRILNGDILIQIEECYYIFKLSKMVEEAFQRYNSGDTKESDVQ